jgi:dTDP-4-amino-4,6-dideoxygalactose transaminase/nucleoside-diphosphate-sugar epimerase
MRTNSSIHVLLSGAGGYLGSILSSMLLEQDYHVTALDTFYFGTETLNHIMNHPNLRIVRGDIRTLDPSLLLDVDAVVHMAAFSNASACELDPSTAMSVNWDATVHLAQLSKAHGIERFLFASSCDVYGTANEELLTEKSHSQPRSLYAYSKKQAEEALIGLASDSFHPVSLRMATLYGLSYRMRFDLILNSMILHTATKGCISVNSDGQHWHPLLHVRDAARAYMLCLEASLNNISNKVFNVVAENYRLAELANLVSQWVGNAGIYIPTNVTDSCNCRVSGMYFETEVGFSPIFSIENGIDEIIKAIYDSSLKDLDRSRYYTSRILKHVISTPALNGGMPFRSVFLPFTVPSIGKNEEKEVIDTLRSGWITTGTKTKRFEDMLCEYLGCRHAIALSSCTSALHVAVASSGIGSGDEVITTPISWPATANVVLLQGAKPVFVDVEPDTLNMNTTKIESAITTHTKAILPVHMAGQPCDMTAIHEIARRYNLLVIEDAAHALGAEYKNTKVGALSEATAFSFHPTKSITTIEGGALTTNDDEFAQKARILSFHGITKDDWKRSSSEQVLHWQLLYPGFKYNMTDVQASLGLHQLPHLDEFIEIQEYYANLYDDAFADLAVIQPLVRKAGIRHAHHLYIILLQLETITITRDEFILELQAENIGTGIHFISMHLQPYYRSTYNLQPEDFPAANWASHRLLSLPLYPKMTKEDVEDVIRAVFKIVRAYRRFH